LLCCMDIWALIIVTVAGVLCHNIAATDDDSTGIDCSVPDWSKVDGVVASEISAVLDDLLRNVYPPYEVITCCTGHAAKCSDCSHHYDIDQCDGPGVAPVRL